MTSSPTPSTSSGRSTASSTMPVFSIRGSVDELSDDDWRHTMTVNLDVPFFLSRAAIPYLLQS